MNKVKYAPFYLASLLPFWVLYIFSDIGFILLYWVIRYRRDVVSSNLMHAFPEKTIAERKKIERGFYRYFCDVFLEMLKVLTVSEESIKKRYVVENSEYIEDLFRQNKSVVLYATHHANWEWFSIFPLSISHHVTAFYKPLRNSYFDGLMLLLRERFGVECIPSKKGYRACLKQRRDGVVALNCIIGDQSPKENSGSYRTTFLNRETSFFTGADVIAKKTNQCLVYPQYSKVKRGYYRVTLKEIHHSPSEVNDFSLIDAYVELLEESLHAYPDMWLWSHKRWKR
ncbi:lysophospholipid acyltransferase family protein [Prolixibacteraceae bacterium]|nr:lysophospholipid acyltransferase family protein [Prolixibacteraceae bacterium]